MMRPRRQNISIYVIRLYTESMQYGEWSDLLEHHLIRRTYKISEDMLASSAMMAIFSSYNDLHWYL